MAAAQAEYRWQVRPRWILAMFGGVGLRSVVEPKNGVTLRVDYGVGKDEGALNVSVGEAF
jgi:hypothetical protein